MVNGPTALDHFERFLAKHQQRCGVDRLDVIQESDDERMKITLTCPTCRSTIGCSVRASDWPELISLLNPEKQK